jgi:hypothetical protein
VRRAGRLLIVSASDATLTALDVAGGDVVWRIRDKMRFCRPVAYDAGELVVVLGDPSVAVDENEAVVCLDAWTASRSGDASSSRRKTAAAPPGRRSCVTGKIIEVLVGRLDRRDGRALGNRVYKA